MAPCLIKAFAISLNIPPFDPPVIKQTLPAQSSGWKILVESRAYLLIILFIKILKSLWS